jgi:hypothetical protein
MMVSKPQVIGNSLTKQGADLATHTRYLGQIPMQPLLVRCLAFVPLPSGHQKLTVQSSASHILCLGSPGGPGKTITEWSLFHGIRNFPLQYPIDISTAPALLIMYAPAIDKEDSFRVLQGIA